MNNDEFLSALKADWRRPPIDVARLHRLTRRHQRLAPWIAGATLASMFAMLLFAIWFGYQAVTDRDPVLAVAAIAFLVALPVLGLEYLETRREASVQYDDTPRGILLQERRRIAHAQRLLSGCRWSSGILGAGAAAILVMILIGVTRDRASTFIAAAWATVAALLWLWQARRARRIAAEALDCDRLLAELSEADEA